jgi:hypothetical protein
MFIYRFKINFEEQEGFSRDIDLLTDQTFLDFHHIIKENLSLNEDVECTFYLCDHRYRKRRRIYQPGATPAVKRHEEEEQNNSAPILYMDKCVLSDYIDDPHQKFLYIYDVAKDWNFYIELSRIMRATESKDYPLIAASYGPVPVEISKKPIPLPGLNDDDDELSSVPGDLDEDDPDAVIDIEDNDEDDTEDGYSDEDLDELDDSSFYQSGSAEMGDDFDETKG